MFFCIDDDNLLRKYEIISTKIEDFENIDLNALRVYDYEYLKNKIRTYDNKVYINFPGLNLPGDDIECKYFAAISFNSLCFYENKYNLQVYLDDCVYKIVDKQMIDFLGENPFETDKNKFLINKSNKCCATRELI